MVCPPLEKILWAPMPRPKPSRPRTRTQKNFLDDDDPRHLGKRSPRYFWAALFFGGGHNAKLVSVVGLWHPGTVLCNLEG